MEKNRNTRILKNSFWLYLRMILNMAIALFCSRVLLNALGVHDFGTVSLLNSLVLVFLVFNAAISNVLQRFLNIQIEMGDLCKAQSIFSMVVIFTVVTTAVILAGESFFCEWILNHKLKIAPDSMGGARVCFHCLLIAVFFQTVMLPWQEAMLAKEKMGFYAIQCIVYSALKLLLAVALCSAAIHRKLEILGGGLIVLAFLYWASSVIFCAFKIPETKFRWVWDRKLYREMLPFFSCTVIGGAIFALNAQGVVLLLGIFFGPVVNAAYAVANQVRYAMSQLSTYLAAAVKPQMVQAYAGGELNYVRKLFFSSCKLSFFAQFLVITPILLEMPYLLKLWLKIVPRYSEIFLLFLLGTSLIWALTVIFGVVNMATGRNRNYEIVGRCITLVSLAGSYVALKFNAPPWSPVAIWLFSDVVCMVYLLWDVRRQIQISFAGFLKEVFGVIVCCSALSLGGLFFVRSILPFGGFSRFAVIALLSVVLNGLLFYFAGCSREEKEQLHALAASLKKRFSDTR